MYLAQAGFAGHSSVLAPTVGANASAGGTSGAVHVTIEAKAKLAAAECFDPWKLPLERVRGKIGDDGIERISTQAVSTRWKFRSVVVRQVHLDGWQG